MSGLSSREFPILCEPCLGGNSFLRITKEPMGKACRICDRPFTVFTWRNSARGRLLSTELCRTCSTLKNVCQCCILDLEFGLPAHIRDAVLGDTEKLKIPTCEVNRDWLMDRYEQQQSHGKQLSSLDIAPRSTGSELVRLLSQQSSPERVCEFFVSGSCVRDPCTFMHDASKDIHCPSPPGDTTITTLHVEGITSNVSNNRLKRELGKFGRVHIIRDKESYALAEFDSREACEAAMLSAWGTLKLDGIQIYLSWDEGLNDTPQVRKRKHEANELIRDKVKKTAFIPIGLAPPPGITVQNSVPDYPSLKK